MLNDFYSVSLFFVFFLYLVVCLLIFPVSESKSNASLYSLFNSFPLTIPPSLPPSLPSFFLWSVRGWDYKVTKEDFEERDKVREGRKEGWREGGATTCVRAGGLCVYTGETDLCTDWPDL